MSLIDLYLEKKEKKDRKKRGKGVLYVTDLVKPCLAQSYYDIVTEKNYELEKLRIFEAGNVLEEYWDKILSDNLKIAVLGTQLPVYYKKNSLNIHGRLDALCQHEKAKLVVHEIKSAKSSHWLNEPRDTHIEQLQFYLNVLEVDNGQIDYLDKESFLFGDNPIDKSFLVTRNPTVFGWLLDRARELKKAARKKEAPAANPHAWNGRVCDYCLHRDDCPTYEEKQKLVLDNHKS